VVSWLLLQAASIFLPAFDAPPWVMKIEIEAAADALSPEQKQELMLFLAARLRANGAKMPEPRAFSPDEIANWMARDETDLERFNAKT
jgi:hypothetical protein